MTVEPFDRRTRLAVLAAALVSVLSILFIRWNYTAAFPEASIDLKLSRQEVRARAVSLLGELGFNTRGFRELLLFDPEEDARLYLERELGLEEANRLMRSRVAVWRWRARWFRPPEKEELVVWLAPDGRLTGFDHVIPEAAAGARLPKDEARAKAEQFLARFTSERRKLVEEQLQERPNRWDYSFTWEDEDFRAREATYRRKVIVHGDAVGQYSEFLHVPENWRRDFARLRSSNDLYAQIASGLYVPLILASLVVLLQHARKRSVPWRPLIVISGTIGALMVLNEWNTMPFFIDRMPTSSPYSETVLMGLLQALGAGAGTFFYVVLAAAAGEPLYRASQPARLALGAAFTRRGIQTREFFTATVSGYAFAAAHIAFVVAFYLLGRRVGVWSPQDIAYSDLLSTRLPWIYPLAISLLASASEEFWFRLLAIPLLKKWIRSTALAVLIPAFVWGFLHANYPQQPGYIRGIEVGLIGVAAGVLMLRQGIVATLVWHYTVDAVMIGMYLFRAESLLFRLSGVLVAGLVALPLILSLAAYRRRGGFLVDPGLTNADWRRAPAPEPEPPPAEVPAAPAPAPAWPVRRLYLAGIVAVAAGLLVKPVPFGGFLRLDTGRERAEAVAVQEMGSRVEGWRRAAHFVTAFDVQDFEYVRRLAGPAAANDAVRRHTQWGLWRVRFFRPLQKEEWRVFIDSSGRVARVQHLLDEKAPGARLSPEQARRVAEGFLARLGISPGDYREVDASQEVRDNRTDHGLVWEDRSFRAGEARARLAVAVQGNEPSNLRRFLKLPEQWVRDFERPRLQSFLMAACVGPIVLTLLVILIRRLSSHRYHWKAYLVVGGAVAVLVALAAAAAWPESLAAYQTETPWTSFVAQSLIGRVVVVLLVALAGIAAPLAVDVFRQLAFGDSALGLPSIPKAAAVAAVSWGAARAVAFGEQWVPGPRYSLPLFTIPGAGSLLPAIQVLAQAFLSALILFAAGALAVCAGLRLLTPLRRNILAAALVVVFALSRSATPGQFAFHLGAVLLWLALLVLVAKTCALDFGSVVLGLFLAAAFSQSAALVVQPPGFYRWNGIAAAVAAALIAVAAIRVMINWTFIPDDSHK